MPHLIQDIRFGFRMLLNRPGVTAVILLALGMGVGINSAIFSVVNGVLIRPLPFKAPDRTMFISESSRQISEMAVSYPNFLDWRERARTFDQLAAFQESSYVLTGTNEPERLSAREVSASFFTMLGVTLLLGRNFTPDEDQPGSGRTVILSYGLWQQRFGGAENILGQALKLSNETYTVVGVLPETFEWESPVDVFVPIGLKAKDLMDRGNHPGIYALGLLKPQVTEEQARTDLTAIARRLEVEYPQTNAGISVSLRTLQDRATADIRPALLILLVAVGLVLLIACANVANLLLARATARSKEVVIRAALGASRWRIVRQLLTESLILSLIGGLLGLLLARLGIVGLLALIPGDVPQLLIRRIGVDGNVLFFTLGISILTGLIFGLAPALQTSKVNLNEALKEGSRGSTGGVRRHLRSLLVVSEVAVAALLLVGSGLLIKSFLLLRNSDLGFDPEGALTMRLSLPVLKYKDDAQVINFYEQLLQRVRRIPGVRSAGLTIRLPMDGGRESNFSVEGQPSSAANGASIAVNLAVTEGYFSAMKIPLLRGRLFSAQDKADTTAVALVDEMLVERYFPNSDPIGKRIKSGDINNSSPWLQIVGVVKHVKHYGPDERGRPEIYLPYWQMTTASGTKIARSMMLVIGAINEPGAISSAVRAEVRQIDKDQPVSQIRTMRQVVASVIAPQRFAAWLLALFSATAMALAIIGVYSVTANSVTQRTREIGIRMALGAHPRDVLYLLVRQGMGMALIGIALGLICAFALTRMISDLLYGVSAADILIYSLVTSLLFSSALLACFFASRKATKVDPMIALRCD
jgi:putative ABC transport system permease protein